MKLISFEKNVYSQFGEDGIIEKVMEVIGPRSKVCVEFGAWDGYHFSNTANLWAHHGWTGVLIEGDRGRAAQLMANVRGFKCIALCRYVGTTAGNTIEDILAENGIHEDIDLLSIDIDGDEYHIISTLKRVQPRVIICEYNPTIPYWLDIYSDEGARTGASVSALVRIACGLGYRLIAITDTNCFFVREDEHAKFAMFDTSPAEIANNKYLNYLMTSYNGRYFVHGKLVYGVTTRKIAGLKSDEETMANLASNRLCILRPPYLRAIARTVFRWLLPDAK